ncbi:hypothetical protein [Kordia jejudonensis]|uniref:hypothetical protein n=1 Tax=Kordia jejudonensis TaxID=1348245 RepID=UPI000628FF10|nr:hypothetical protein [Kordia jejudonensis]
MILKKTYLSIIILLISVIQISYSQKGEIKSKDSTKFQSNNNKLSLIKEQYDLSDSKLFQLTKNDSVINELILLLKDSTKIERVKYRLASYYDGKYNVEDLIFTLKLERLLKSGCFELSDSVDFKRAVHFKSVEELNRFVKKIDDTLVKNLNFDKRKDSIKQRKKQ